MDKQIQDTRNFLSKYLSKSKDYFDFNLMNKKEIRIIVDKENVNIGKSSDKGGKLRLWDGEKFLEEASTKYDIGTLEKNFDTLQSRKNLETVSNFTEIKVDKKKDVQNFITEEEKTLTLEEKTNKIKEIRDTVSKLDHVVNCRAAFIEEIEHHLFVNNYKDYYQDVIGKTLVVIAYIKASNGEIKMAYESV